jgi:hypothetical protein
MQTHRVTLVKIPWKYEIRDVLVPIKDNTKHYTYEVAFPKTKENKLGLLIGLSTF